MINFQVAYGWLYQFEEIDSNLGTSARLMNKDIQESLARNNYSELDGFIKSIKKLASTSTKILEAAEIHLICAQAYYARGEMEKALLSLDEAGNLYISDAHKYAVTQWMKGCVLWELEGKQVEALTLWQRSLDAFERLQKQYLINKQSAQWYQQQCEKMRQSILQANPKHLADPRISQDLYPILKQILTHDTRIPLSPTKTNSNQFWIENRVYQLINLGTTSPIDLANTHDLFVLWVEDDTMDELGILQGDHVLVRWQNTANHNSIVLVAIANEDTHAKLKNFIQAGSKIILRPLSKNPAHQERDFPGMNIGFEVKGVVLGVFKPI